MIARYTDHAANERTFLAWIRTGLTVAAFGFFLVKLNIPVDAAGGDTLPRLAAEGASALVAAPARYGGLVMVVIGTAIIARGSADFERTRCAIDSDEIIRMPRSRVQLLISIVIAIAVTFFGIYLAVL